MDNAGDAPLDAPPWTASAGSFLRKCCCDSGKHTASQVSFAVCLRERFAVSGPNPAHRASSPETRFHEVARHLGTLSLRGGGKETISSVAKKLECDDDHVKFMLTEMDLEGVGTGLSDQEKLERILKGNSLLEEGHGISDWHTPFDGVGSVRLSFRLRET